MKIVLADSFKRGLKQLQKRFRHVKDDARLAIEVLEQAPQLGVAIPNGEGVRKLRVTNSDLSKGKSGGYRLIYLFLDEPEPTLFLLLLYAKVDRADVTRQELMKLLAQLPMDTLVTDRPSGDELPSNDTLNETSGDAT